MIRIEETINSPEILIEDKLGIIKIHGNSYLNNPFSIYQKVFDWINEYDFKIHDTFTIDLKISYCGSSSLQLINRILVDVEKKSNKAHLKIHLDEEDKEDGLQFYKEIYSNTNLIPEIIFYS